MQQARRILLFIAFLVTSLFFSGPRLSAVATELSHAPEILQYVREDKVYLLEKIRHQITKPSEKIVVEALLSEDGPRAATLYLKQLTDYPDPLMDPISRSRLSAYGKAVETQAAPPAIPAKYSSAARPSPTAPATNPAHVASKPDSASRQLSAAPAIRPVTVPKTVTATSATTSKPSSAVAPAPAPAGKPEASSRNTAPSASSKAQPAEKQASAKSTGTAKPALTSGFTLQFGSFDSVANANHLASQLSANAPASVQKINGIYKVRLKNIFATRAEAAAFARTLPIESFVVTIQP
ncbi:MAG TPA: SPOR domain-containing protein [Chlorobaculum sp.]|nr:SPOR domain-containing protein [Chlorobaculum sp.]